MARRNLIVLAMWIASAPPAAKAYSPPGSAFSYQGQLKQSGSPVNGNTTMTFSLWDAASLGTQQGSTLTFDGVGGNPPPVSVSNGLFTVQLDFGMNPYTSNEARWLQIMVNSQPLLPRQPMTPTPFSMNTRGINVNSSGNVGIGAAVPGNKLEVAAASNGDGVRLTGASVPLQSPGYHLYDAATQRGTLGLAEGTTAFSTDAAAGDIVLRSNTGKLLFQNGTGASAMAITGNRVGIGTTSPENTLHVMKASAGAVTGNTNAPLIVENDSSTFISILAPDANEQGILFGKPTGGSAAGGIIYDSASTTDGLQFRVNGNSTRMVLDSAGQLGLGTLAPEQTLEVAGASPAVRVTGDNTNIARLEIRNGPGTGSVNGSIGRLDFINGTGPPAASISANSYAGLIMNFELPQGTTVARLFAGGDFVCDGDINCGGTLYADGLSVSGMGSGPAAYLNRQPDDGVIVALRQGGTTEGTISVSGSTVSYNAFTGSHYAWTDEKIERGMLVYLTGSNRRTEESPDSEMIYGVARTTVANDSRCLGAYLGLENPARPGADDNPHLIMAVGNGDMWVVDAGKDILPGDRLISSHIPGHAMSDDPEKFPTGYIVGRAAEGVEWSRVKPSSGGLRRIKISVLFESFVRDSRATELQRKLTLQQRRIDELEARIETLGGILEKRPEGGADSGAN